MNRAEVLMAETFKRRRIRVVMVVRLFYPWIGGTENQSYRLAKKLIEKNLEVEIVTGWWFRGTRQREFIDQIPVFRNQTLWEFFGIKGLRKFGGYLYILSLLWYLWRRRADYDLIHVHGFSYHTFAAVLAGRWTGHKTLTKLANSGQDSDIKKMQSNYELFLSRYMLGTALASDRFVALNRKIVEELIAAGVTSDKVTELNNGVDCNQFITKDTYSLHHPVRIIFVGRLHEQKSVDTLLFAFQRLLQLTPGSSLCLQLLGDGPLRDELIRLAGQLGISGQVEFVGGSDRVREYLSAADIFVLPSRAEGLSNALLEAMACALPVVVSKIPGNIAVIEHNENGLFFNTGDPDSLAQSVYNLLNQPNLRERLGRAARRTVEEHYSLDQIADQYIALYQDLLSK